MERRGAGILGRRDHRHGGDDCGTVYQYRRRLNGNDTAMDNQDLIFKGATRPAMMAGVPIVPFILAVGVHLLAAVWAMAFIGAFVMFIIMMACVMNVFFMRYISSQDDQRLLQHLLRLKSIAGRRNSKHWGAHSISPTDYRKRK